ncbi:MAG: winged helix-turn-helix transcriptional regulator [Candidatus Thermoplasmatota archaeon]|nr:winged helix-turn-helix transcriptional regulator [Candidatus Thermoplasmatota archaeon]
MKDKVAFRERLLRMIIENPGLHFRELQRRTNSAIGKLDYHLYQLERDGKIISRKDSENVRFFSNESGTISDRKIAFYLRNKTGKDLLFSALSNKSGVSSDLFAEKELNIIKQMESDGIIEVIRDGKNVRFELKDRGLFIAFLKKYGYSFIDSIALSILGLLDES